MEQDQNVEKMIVGFKEKWRTGYEYNSNHLVLFRGAKVPAEIQTELYMCLFYMGYLYKLADRLDQNVLNLDETLMRQVNNYQNKGGLCIYLSVVLYWILRKHTNINKKLLHYCQGLYRITFEELDDILLHGPGRDGLHAWLEINKSIVDISIKQIEAFYDFKGAPIILGEVPADLELIGFRETHECVKAYAKQLANEVGLNRKEWIKQHYKNAVRVFIEHQKKGRNNQAPQRVKGTEQAGN